jgi:DNA processing protein
LIGIGPADPRYPSRLLDLRAPPDPLWIDGDHIALDARTVSIVGTRRMTPYGSRVARELAAACADAGIVVVSGLAQGVDSAAHQGAVDARGRTVAVLGAGVASYLREARGRRRVLAHAVRASGALVSEFPPDAPAQNWTFAQRNATIAALGEVTVVVEAPIGSGALITAEYARRLRRPLYAVPGPIGVAASAGVNALIATGIAKALTGAGMLLEAIGASRRAPIVDVDAIDARIVDALASSPAGPDALARRVGIGAGVLSERLARLVIRGVIAGAPDGRFVLR